MRPTLSTFILGSALTLNADAHNIVDKINIPISPGRIPIRVEEDEFATVVARVHVSMALRVFRWLGVQKTLYVVYTGSDEKFEQDQAK